MADLLGPPTPWNRRKNGQGDFWTLSTVAKETLNGLCIVSQEEMLVSRCVPLMRMVTGNANTVVWPSDTHLKKACEYFNRRAKYNTAHMEKVKSRRCMQNYNGWCPFRLPGKMTEISGYILIKWSWHSRTFTSTEFIHIVEWTHFPHFIINGFDNLSGTPNCYYYRWEMRKKDARKENKFRHKK